MRWTIDVIGVIGVGGTFYFGIRSLFQSADIKVARAMTQAYFNHMWYVGDQMDKILTSSNTDSEIIKHAASANGVSHASRQMVANLGREHFGLTPKYEPAWDIKEVLNKKERPWWRWFFAI
jgi:hypothetical protein